MEGPQITMSRIGSEFSAYSILADTALLLSCGGTILPAFGRTNRSPGDVCVIRSSEMHEPEHAITDVSGFWQDASS